jgi:hypothetical protein
LIPISKHYEICEDIFNNVLSTIKKYDETDQIYYFNNNRSIQAFYKIEANGINVNKSCFIDYYREHLKYPELNIHKGKIYTQYNLYTTTSRPSNTFNNINFAALNKEDGERKCYTPKNDMFLELDIQGMHPRLIGDLVCCPFPKLHNTYETLADILDVDINKAKELTFKQLYGGVWEEYKKKPFFEDVHKYVINLWQEFNTDKQTDTENRLFKINELENITAQKLFNYIIQSYETSTNVRIIENILELLAGRNTQLVLYTYDSFLLDYDTKDEAIIQHIIDQSPFLFNIKQGKSYHGLTKI